MVVRPDFDPHGLLGKARCHICNEAIHGQAIEHGGTVIVNHPVGNNPRWAIERAGEIYLHPECAVTLVMRISADLLHCPDFRRKLQP